MGLLETAKPVSSMAVSPRPSQINVCATAALLAEVTGSLHADCDAAIQICKDSVDAAADPLLVQFELSSFT